MTRLEFLKVLWDRLFRPALIAIILFVAINFFYRVVAENGGERQIVVTLIIIITTLTLLLLITLVSLFLTDWLSSRLPKTVRKAFVRLSTVIRYLSPLAVVALLYYLWEEENYGAIIAAIFFIFLELRRILIRRDTSLPEKSK